jgi:hypothetical protein
LPAVRSSGTGVEVLGTEACRVANEIVVVGSALREGVESEEQQERVLSDGSRHKVYKRYFDSETLAKELGRGRTLLSGTWFVAVSARLARPGMKTP